MKEYLEKKSNSDRDIDGDLPSDLHLSIRDDFAKSDNDKEDSDFERLLSSPLSVLINRLEGSPQNRGDLTPDAILSKTNQLFNENHQDYYLQKPGLSAVQELSSNVDSSEKSLDNKIK